MLILAGISLTLIIGPNGIIKKAETSKQLYLISNKKEKIEMTLIKLNMEEIEKEKNLSIDTIEEKILEELDEKETSIVETIKNEENNYIIIEYEKDYFEINERLGVRYIEGYNRYKLQLGYESLKLPIGENKTIEVITNVQNEEINWKSSNEEIVRVENGKIEAISLGTAEIIASISKYNTSAKCIITTYEKEEVIFDYIGNYSTFKAKETGKYKIECWGASGVTWPSYGNGAYISGIIELEKDSLIYIYVGEGGRGSAPWQGSGNAFNGGGASGVNTDGVSGGSGGGATDVRLIAGNWNDGNSMKSRIMVAGGGGGGNPGNNSSWTHPEYASAGGSSFISGHNGCNAINESGSHTNTAVHYSGYKFSDTIMIDGAGYKWTNVRNEKVDMQTKDGKSTMVGNVGNGYCKISYIEE